MPSSSPAGRKHGTYSHSGLSPMDDARGVLARVAIQALEPFATSSSSR